MAKDRGWNVRGNLNMDIIRSPNVWTHSRRVGNVTDATIENLN
jgi:mRNA-degrading endonuclease toxin of MazEF toxin-antitoxin module